MYKYHQLIGGKEPWHATDAARDISGLKPTFITVLSLDTLSESDPTPAQKDRIKYHGPMYFDIDSSDIQEAIDSAKQLHTLLLAKGLTDDDIAIYLSGKKGLHLLVPPEAFMEKPAPVARLPAIYKEIGFKMAVPCLDFAVYTAKRGRMFRTIYNVRENGLYKVAITADQLRSLTPELYEQLASVPSGEAVTNPKFSHEFSMVYKAAQDKVAAWKPRKSKPTTPQQLESVRPVLARILAGESNQGFNKIAMQLAIYARECGWTEDTLTEAAANLIENHTGDGGRYGSPSLRRNELIRMFHYVNDNPGYEYSQAILERLLSKVTTVAPPTEEDKRPPPPENVVFAEGSHGEVLTTLEGMFLVTENGTTALSDASFSDLTVGDVGEGKVQGFVANLYVRGELIAKEVAIDKDTFAGASNLHKFLSAYRSGFWGADGHARKIQAALYATQPQTTHAVDFSGLDLIKFPNSTIPGLQKGVLVWAGQGGCACAPWAAELAKFVHNKDESNLHLSDLMLAPAPATLFGDDEGKHHLQQVIDHLLKSNTPSVVGQLYGWTTALFYRPLFMEAYGQFPLLHIAGAAGGGKTANVRLAMNLHSHNRELPEVSPSSTTYAVGSYMNSYSGCPVLLDEFKPHRMVETKLEGLRALMRENYNGKASSRGGGNGSSSSTFRGISQSKSRAGIVFVAEAVETETAIVERSTIVSITRRRSSTKSFEHFEYVRANKHMLSSLGQGIVRDLIARGGLSTLEDLGFSLLRAAVKSDLQTVRDGDMPNVAKARRSVHERAIHNCAVVIFGIERFWDALTSVLGEERMAKFGDWKQQAIEATKTSTLEANLTATPELIKWLMDISEMCRASAGRSDVAQHAKLCARGDDQFLVLNVRALFSEYRAFARQRGLGLYYASPESCLHALTHVEGYEGGLSTSEIVVIEYNALSDMGLTGWWTKPVKWKDL